MSAYSSIYPLSQRTNGQYLPNDTVDFLLDFAGREIVKNSIRISGNLVVTQGEAVVNATQDIYFDAKTGCHGLFQQYIVSSSDKVIQNFQSAPRWLAMMESAKNSAITCGGTLDHAAALQCAKDEDTQIIMAGGKSFSVKPYIGINNSSANLPYSKFGQIKITCLVSSITQFLFGDNVNANTAFYLTDLQLSYRTVPEVTVGPVVMEVITTIKQTVSSQQNQLSVICPNASSAIALSFVPLATENALTAKYTRMSQLPAVKRVESSYNDITVGVSLQFALENPQEISLNYLMAMGWDGITSQTVDGDYYGIGFDFGDRVLPNTKIGVYIESEIASAYAAYMYFKGLTEF
jgi:hypothetical protein